ncbi:MULTISPECIES: cytochrome d ubiquinol oxidase subunit II [Candidatus Ichthyocystis]|uniref:cytochrome d ubiquinol oxidase subunit II n=1 Tax=Candidatus Ichthyocystis TaxID=2929841 RepID=UPI000A402D60|nr:MULTISPECIES: cytochrome d ubiquinol oxidase subunit II [Ichthyocystis]
MKVIDQYSWSFLSPVIAMGLMGLSLLLYVILDGYVLGIGVLSRYFSKEDKDRLVNTVAPFWDANQTWLVLGVGLLIVCFPLAQGVVLGKLYIPVVIMLIGLIVRGVSFEFRAKFEEHKDIWNSAFHISSVVVSFSQGVMLGQYVTGLSPSFVTICFSILTGFCLVFGHILLGSSWLIIKSSGDIHSKAICWAKRGVVGTALGVAAISVVTPVVSYTILEKWFRFPNVILLMPIPLVTAGLFLFVWFHLRSLSESGDHRCSIWPFWGTVLIFFMSFIGLAYSLFPYLVMDQINIWDAAAATQSLNFIFIGAAIVLPLVFVYTGYVHTVFKGKLGNLY